MTTGTACTAPAAAPDGRGTGSGATAGTSTIASGTASGSDTTSSTTTSATTPTQSAAEIFGEAVAAAKAATSFRITGTVRTGLDELHLDIAGRVDGTNQSVRMVYSAKGSVELLTIGEQTFLKVDQVAAASLGAKNPAAIAGKWIAAPGSLAASFADVNLEQMVILLESITKFDPTVTTQLVDGITCYRLTSSGADAGVAYVAADGSSRLVRLVATGTQQSDLSFSQWNDVDPFPVPDPKTVIQLPTTGPSPSTSSTSPGTTMPGTSAPGTSMPGTSMPGTTSSGTSTTGRTPPTTSR